MVRMMVLTAVAILAQPAAAQDAAQEKLARECNAIYVKLCKGIKRGPELVGQCFDKYPKIMEKLPAKCESDFQTNVENYHEAKGQK